MDDKAYTSADIPPGDRPEDEQTWDVGGKIAYYVNRGWNSLNTLVGKSGIPEIEYTKTH